MNIDSRFYGMQSLLFLASSGKSDPSVSIFLGLGAFALLVIGIYALAKVKMKSDAKTDEDWKKAADALGLQNVSAWKHWIMKGSLEGREVSIALRSLPMSKYSEVRHLFCQITFGKPLGSPFSIEPTPIFLLQSMGGDDTNIPVFDDKFKVVTADLDYLNSLLRAAPETMDGRILADEILHRTIQRGQRICLTESALEVAVESEDISNGLSDRIREQVKETIGLADLIERRAQSVGKRSG